MEQTISALTLVAVLFFSVTVALFFEELLFGGLFRLFFARQRVPREARPEETKSDQGD